MLVFLFPTYFTLYNRLQFHPPHKNWFKCILFNGWVKFHCVYVPQLSYPFICLWTSRLLPCPGYYKQCCDEHWGTHVSFNSGFLKCVCPAVGLLGHMAVLFPVFLLFFCIYSTNWGMICMPPQLCPPQLCNPMDCSPQVSSVHGFLQARTLEWVAISFSRGSSWPRDGNCLSCISCLVGRFFTNTHHLGSQLR